MKKLLAALAIPAAAVIMLAMTTPQSHAAAPTAMPAPAIHIIDGGCSFADGDGNFLAGDRSTLVITSSGNGNITCKSKGLPNSTGQAVQYNFENTGELCYIGNVGTETWQETVSASGNATLTCHAKI